MNERRQRRIESLLKERIAEIVDQDLADPRRGMITITRVKVDKDLQVCHVFWSVLGGPNAQTRSGQVLARAAGFIQREVAPILRTRSMPRIKFVHDEGLEGAMRIDRILHELRGEPTGADAAAGTPLATDGTDVDGVEGDGADDDTDVDESDDGEDTGEDADDAGEPRERAPG